jgi:hypothetical protein
MPVIWDNFERAVQVLVGPGPLKQRLIDAYLGHLSLVKPVDIPEPASTAFTALIEALKCARPTGGLSCAEVAVRKMSELEAARHAQGIVECFVALSWLRVAEADAPTAPPRLRVVSDSDGEEVPSFLSRA